MSQNRKTGFAVVTGFLVVIACSRLLTTVYGRLQPPPPRKLSDSEIKSRISYLLDSYDVTVNLVSYDAKSVSLTSCGESLSLRRALEILTPCRCVGQMDAIPGYGYVDVLMVGGRSPVTIKLFPEADGKWYFQMDSMLYETIDSTQLDALVESMLSECSFNKYSVRSLRAPAGNK